MKGSRGEMFHGRQAQHRRLPFAVLPGMLVYIVAVICVRVFTQALRSPLSSMLYIFMFILPAVSLIGLLFSRLSIKILLDSGKGETVKLAPVGFIFRIINDSPLVFPFVEADLTVPDATRVRCTGCRVRLALVPFGCYDLSENLVFSYCGRYEIGVSDLYVYDLLRLFRMRIHIGRFDAVTVMPRRLALEEPIIRTASDNSYELSKNERGIDRADISDIREYRGGDSMKSIHWKLSSKSQDLVVRQYTMNAGNTLYVFADLTPHFSNSGEDGYVFLSDTDEFMADGVIEGSIAVVTRALKDGCSCNLVWYDRRTDCGYRVAQIGSGEELERIIRSFVTTGLCDPGKDFYALSGIIGNTLGVSAIFVTGHFDAEAVRKITEIGGLFGLAATDAVSVYYIDPSQRIADAEKRDVYIKYIEHCRKQLALRAIRFTDAQLN